jgi:excisionase family DNA binding protein
VTLTLEEAARLLKHNPEVLRRNLDKWGVPYAKPGRKYLFTESALLGYLNSRQAPRKEEECHFGGKEVASGISASREYASLLERKSTKTPRLSKTG